MKKYLEDSNKVEVNLINETVFPHFHLLKCTENLESSKNILGLTPTSTSSNIALLHHMLEGIFSMFNMPHLGGGSVLTPVHFGATKLKT